MPAVPFVMAALTYTGATAAIGTTIAGLVGATVGTVAATAIGGAALSAGFTIAQGGSVSDALKGAVIGGIASYAGGSIAASVGNSVSSAAANLGMDTIAKTMGNVAGSMAGGAVASGIGAAAYGRDPLQAMLQGGITAGLSSSAAALVNYTTSQIPGFDTVDPATGKTVKGDLPLAAQRAIKSAMASGVLGQNPNQAAINSVLSSAGQFIGSTVKDKVIDVGNYLKESYDKATTSAANLDSNFSQQQKLASELTPEAAALQTKSKALQVKIDDYNAAQQSNPSKGQLGSIASSVISRSELQHEIDDFNVEYEAFNTKKSTFDSLQADQKTLETDFVTSKADLDKQTAAFQEAEKKNADLVINQVNQVSNVQSAYKTSTGSELTQEELAKIYAGGNNDLMAGAAKDLGYSGVDEMNNAILAKEVPANILPGMEAKQGETAGTIKKDILEDGSTVYSRTFTGKSADGKDYSYTASYDPNSQKQLTYEVNGGVTPEAASSGAPISVVASETRPTFNTEAPKNNQQAVSNAYNNYVNSQVLAATANTPENLAAADQAKLYYELAQKSAAGFTNATALPTGVDSGYTGVVPASELGSQSFPITPQDTSAMTPGYGRILSGLASSGLLTAPTQAAPAQSAPATGALSTTTTYKTPAPYVEQPSYTLTKLEAGKAPLLFGAQLARGGLAFNRIK